MSTKMEKSAGKKVLLKDELEDFCISFNIPNGLLRHYNHLEKRYTSEPNYRRKEPIKVIYDLSEVSRPQLASEQNHSSKHKRQPSLILIQKEKDTTFEEGKFQKREMFWGDKNTPHGHKELI